MPSPPNPDLGPAAKPLPAGQYLKLLFLPYLGLGLFTTAMIFPQRGGRPASAKEMAILAAAHVVLLWLAIFLAGKSKVNGGKFRFGLSPSGWWLGFSLTYITGAVIGLFAV